MPTKEMTWRFHSMAFQGCPELKSLPDFFPTIPLEIGGSVNVAKERLVRTGARFLTPLLHIDKCCDTEWPIFSLAEICSSLGKQSEDIYIISFGSMMRGECCCSPLRTILIHLLQCCTFAMFFMD
ncbi:uncharacterized protein LOC115979291 [Quercus lobata]|uniref:uncharacterized protein LOC115979291 n=1 Tax=Quercus lobata TaxID=97700 RepID=UPI00124804F8|nr:uncharacterized protein LOC115979291 [Quercus lobata]